MLKKQANNPNKPYIQQDESISNERERKEDEMEKEEKDEDYSTPKGEMERVCVG